MFLTMIIKVDNFVEARWKYFCLVDNHTPNQSGFPRSNRSHNRNEAVRLSTNSLVHYWVGKIWPKQADRRASIPDANLLSASQNVRKDIQKMTRIKITKWWINITSKDRSSFKSSPPQRFTQNGNRFWSFWSKTRRSMLHWEMFAKSGSSTTSCSWSTQSSL